MNFKQGGDPYEKLRVGKYKKPNPFKYNTSIISIKYCPGIVHFRIKISKNRKNGHI